METIQHAAHGARAASAPALPDPAAAECMVRAALLAVLSSSVFNKAQRMCRLLRFLVEKRLDGALRDTAEYAIGIDVFDRDPNTYSTGDDPIVRVQVGRLRERLKTYYATDGAQANVRFSIPIGSYMPEISSMEIVANAFGERHLLALLPLLSIGGAVDGSFTQGLNEELAYRLFQVFGHKIVSHTFAASAQAPGPPARIVLAGVSHCLEGSVRVDGESIRVSVRLIDAGAGCIAWSAQFDCRGPYSFTQQEQLAVAVCDGLQGYFVGA